MLIRRELGLVGRGEDGMLGALVATKSRSFST